MALAAVTIAASAVILVAGWTDRAAVLGGMVPAQALGGGRHPGGVPWWLQPLSATLIHGNWLHLAFNLVMLVFAGQQVERAIGGRSLLLLYAIGAYAAALGNWALSPHSAVPAIGASGAISAVIGSYALLYGRQRTRAIGPFPARLVQIVWLALAWVAIQALVGFAGGGGTMGAQPVQIAIGAHIGGFIAGLTLARPLLLWRYRGA